MKSIWSLVLVAVVACFVGCAGEVDKDVKVEASTDTVAEDLKDDETGKQGITAE